jgi:hypothetical protein
MNNGGKINHVYQSSTGLDLISDEESWQRTPLPKSAGRISWQLDNDVNDCFECKTLFTIFFRRHHCRKCGIIYCNNCCPVRINQRICNSCFNGTCIMAAATLQSCPVCSRGIRVNSTQEMEAHVSDCIKTFPTQNNRQYLCQILQSDVKNECPICFEDFERGNTIARLPCLCVFHKDCIDIWFETSVDKNCPTHGG